MPTNDTLNTSLIEASRNGNLEQVLALVSSKPYKDWDFSQALYWAVSHNRVACVEYLLNSDCRAWDMCPEKWVGIKFDQASWYEKSVSNAADSQYMGCLNLLVEALYSMRNPPERFFQTAFVDACENGKIDSAQRLLEVVDPKGTTFVHKGLVSAAYEGHVDIVRFLCTRIVSTHWLDAYSTYCPSKAFVGATTRQQIFDVLQHGKDFLAIANELKMHAKPQRVLDIVAKEIAMGNRFTGNSPTPYEILREWANSEILREKIEGAVCSETYTKRVRKL